MSKCDRCGQDFGDPSDQWATHAHSSDCIQYLKDVIERLQRTLPRTKDGVVVMPGNTTWKRGFAFGEWREVHWGVLPWHDVEKLQEVIGKTYSTKEAAIAAEGE